MATKTSKTKKTAAAAKAAPKATARANTKAPKRSRAVPATAGVSLKGIDMKTALFGAGADAVLGTLATKLIFFR